MQRFASYEDLDRYNCTIEEREEYEPHIDRGVIVYAGVAFIRNEAAHVLLQRRGDDGSWGLCGGGMELGERIDQTIVNEVREETALEVEPLRVAGIYSGPD